MSRVVQLLDGHHHRTKPKWNANIERYGNLICVYKRSAYGPTSPLDWISYYSGPQLHDVDEEDDGHLDGDKTPLAKLIGHKKKRTQLFLNFQTKKKCSERASVFLRAVSICRCPFAERCHLSVLISKHFPMFVHSIYVLVHLYMGARGVISPFG